MTKTGPGTLGLTNTANTYTGGTFINGGTVAAAGTGSLGAPTAAVTFSNNSGLSLLNNMTLLHPLILNTSSATLDTGANTVTFNGSLTDTTVISGTGDVIKKGTGKLDPRRAGLPELLEGKPPHQRGHHRVPERRHHRHDNHHRPPIEPGKQFARLLDHREWHPHHL